MSQPNTDGRKANAAEPLGQFTANGTDKGATRTSERERRSAGPDGPDARDHAAVMKPPKGSKGDPQVGTTLTPPD